MAKSRIALHQLLVRTIKSKAVYFQPPSTIKMSYPCIVYKLDDIDAEYGDNNPYKIEKRYSVTVITKNPDSDLPDRIAALPMCRMSRAYTADNLNHYVFELFF